MNHEETPKITQRYGQQPPLTEGLDYYLEHGRYVFTAYFLKKRGYCCQSGCRHCPYGFKHPGKSSEDN